MAVRFLVFLSIVLAVLGLGYLYLGRRLAGWPPSGLGVLVWALFAVHVVSIPAAFVLQRDTGGALGDGVAWVAFTGLGLVSLLFVFTVSVDLVGLALRGLGGLSAMAGVGSVDVDLSRRALFGEAMRVGILGGSAALVVAGVAEARRLARVVEVDIPIADLPPALEGFRIAQLSDIHIGPTIKGSYLAELVRRTNELEPDLVALTGDLVDGSVRLLREHTAPLADLRARHGSFFVTGNHEYYSGVEEWVAEVSRLGLRVLHNEHVDIEVDGARLALCGVPDMQGGRFGEAHRPDYAAALAGTEEAALRVLLAHQPLQIRGAEGLGVDLQLSGHTHGGQYFPFTLLIKLAQPYAAGLHRVANTFLYVNPGSGYWGPPLRVGQPAEITLLRLTRAAG